LYSSDRHQDQPQRDDHISPGLAHPQARHKRTRRRRVRPKVQQRRGEEHDECDSPDGESKLGTNAGTKAESESYREDQDRALPESGKEYVCAHAEELGREIHLRPFRLAFCSVAADSA
jgi:hypothetical protein